MSDIVHVTTRYVVVFDLIVRTTLHRFTFTFTHTLSTFTRLLLFTVCCAHRTRLRDFIRFRSRCLRYVTTPRLSYIWVPRPQFHDRWGYVTICYRFRCISYVGGDYVALIYDFIVVCYVRCQTRLHCRTICLLIPHVHALPPALLPHTFPHLRLYGVDCSALR